MNVNQISSAATTQVRIKICGVTNATDARVCSDAGVDLIGFNFYPRSPRYVAPPLAREIASDANMDRVGVFVNAPLEDVARVVEDARLDAVQLHGDETPDYCRGLRARLPASCRIIKALRVGDGFELENVGAFGTDAVLLDAHAAGAYGGTGHTFDWEIAARAREIEPRLFLAGGLTAERVGTAVRAVRPAGVDACSGVESAPGVKSAKRIAEFVAAVRRAEREMTEEMAEGEQR